MYKELTITNSFKIILWINIFGKNNFLFYLLPGINIRFSLTEKVLAITFLWLLFEINFYEDWEEN
jgi:hypothetical protein